MPRNCPLLVASGYIQFSFLTQSLHFVFTSHVLVLVAVVIGLFIILSMGSGNPDTFWATVAHLPSSGASGNCKLTPPVGARHLETVYSQVILIESINYSVYSLEVRKMGLEYVFKLRK